LTIGKGRYACATLRVRPHWTAPPVLTRVSEAPLALTDACGGLHAGQEAYDAINAASFKGCHVFLLCFAMRKGREASLSNAYHKWFTQLTDGGHLANGAKIILVGTQKDAETYDGVDDKALKAAEQIGAAGYMPTSALMPLDQGGVPELFNQAVRLAIYED
jgi:GTPase SAR1 family protein